MGIYLVTGGAGFIGSAVARKLLENHNKVTIIDNLSTGYVENVPLNANFIEGDCSQMQTISKLNNQKFDAIFHIAGQSSGEVSFETPIYDIECNTISTLQLLQFAVKTGCKKIIYASTMSVYGDHGKQIVSEIDETNPKSFYAVGKLASEYYLKVFKDTYDIDFVALRYFNVYGPGQNMFNMKQGMVSIYLKQIIDTAYSEVLVKGNLDRFRDFVYIDDVVNITVDAIANNKMQNQILNIGTGKKTSIYEVLNILMNSTNIRKEVKVEKGTPGDQFGIYADNSKLRNCLDFEFTSFKKGVELFVKSILI